jgi:aspartyl-tRNA(Asn)/glutamyl-tRNA(Gln) amidotransferase subunit C
MTDRPTIEKVARLAGIEISDEEFNRFAEDFRKIVDFVSTLEEVDAENAEPMVSPVHPEQFLRRDTPGKHISEATISEAPNLRNNFIVIKKEK